MAQGAPCLILSRPVPHPPPPLCLPRTRLCRAQDAGGPEQLRCSRWAGPGASWEGDQTPGLQLLPSGSPGSAPAPIPGLAPDLCPGAGRAEPRRRRDLPGRPQPPANPALKSSFAWPWSCLHGSRRSGSGAGSRRRRTYSGSCSCHSPSTEPQPREGWPGHSLPAFVIYLFINSLLLGLGPGAPGMVGQGRQMEIKRLSQQGALLTGLEWRGP